MKCYRIVISGDVVRKGFRFSAMQMAYKQNIKGYVRYQSGGSVVIEAEGEEEGIKNFIGWCERGPVWATVEKVIVKEVEIKGFVNFSIYHVKIKEEESPIQEVEISDWKLKFKNLFSINGYDTTNAFPKVNSDYH